MTDKVRLFTYHCPQCKSVAKINLKDIINKTYNQAIDDAIEIITTDVERRPYWSSPENKERINFIINTIRLLKK